MTHREKVACFEQLLRDRGYWISSAIPPVTRLLWRLGIEAPPPYFLSFGAAVLLAGVPFAFFWGAIMWLIKWQFSYLPLVQFIPVAAFAGLLFGFSMAVVWRRCADNLRLKSWSQFPDGIEEPDGG